jgi:hypothetical protein
MAATFNPTYQDWAPGLDNDHLLLRDVRQSLPGNMPAEISPIVKLFENPCSPLALRGAVSLERHDCIHILLGRGLTNQDEAFVIGFTMGTAKSLTWIEVALFRFLARWVYPAGYRLSRAEARAFDLGVEAGRALGVKRLYRFPLEQHMQETVGALRRRLGIDLTRLRDFYRREQAAIPGTPASARLPV